MERQWIFVIFLFISGKASGQCTFPSPFAGSTWHDSTRGTLVFTNTTVTGWNIVLGTAATTTLSTWQCLNNSDPSRLVMKATQTWTFSGKAVHVYACLKITEVTAGVSYTYVQQASQELNGRQNRLKFTVDGTLKNIADICNETAVIPTLDFHVLVKSGSEAAAAITVPDRFLFSADYDYIATDLTVSCNATNDTFDMCTNTSALAITYSGSTCTQKIAYSAGGAFYSVVKVSMSSYDCVVFYNRDATLTGSYTRFTCICSNGTVASVAPSNCTINQTPTEFPTEADMMTAKGHKLDFKKVHTSCPKTTPSTTTTTTTVAPAPASSNNAGAIAGGVIVAIVVVAVVVLALIIWKTGKCGQVSELVSKVSMAAKRTCPCCSNKVEEGKITGVTQNGHGPKAEVATVNEENRPALHKERSTFSTITREKSALSAITRSSTLNRQATVASIGGVELKSDRSERSVTHINVKPTGEEVPKEPRFQLFGKDLSFLICCPAKESEPVEQAAEPSSFETAASSNKTDVPTGKGDKKGGKKGKKGAKGKGKGGKKKTSETQTGKNDEATNGELKQSPRATSTPIPNGQSSNVDQSPKSTSTPTPNRKSSNGVLAINSGAAAMLKPEAKSNEWRFLACCFGKRSPEPPAEEPKEPEREPEPKKKAAKTDVKGGKGAKKVGGKKGGKKGAKGGKGKKDEKMVVEEVDEQVEADLAINRAKTMPERNREKTTLSITDAGKIKVDVYVPDDKTNLQLKDTVTVVNGTAEVKKLPKAKTTLGVVTPPEEKPASAGGKAEKKEKKGDKKKPAKGGKGGKASKKKKK
ncbi:hypothetical protein DPMN_104587 [Dreissena polymorpha]|uniref:Uncharacterized protein n=1 Tax=Dreissena polymorpha TaxID=45954 RepID=A0A9D4H820_DREPO|nr:hypothetical protein DPMN_104587 [Dreissena polymorpha]